MFRNCLYGIFHPGIQRNNAIGSGTRRFGNSGIRGWGRSLPRQGRTAGKRRHDRRRSFPFTHPGIRSGSQPDRNPHSSFRKSESCNRLCKTLISPPAPNSMRLQIPGPTVQISDNPVIRCLSANCPPERDGRSSLALRHPAGREPQTLDHPTARACPNGRPHSIPKKQKKDCLETPPV